MIAILVLFGLLLAIPAAISTGIKKDEGCAFTKGGWGAPPRGNNPGALLHREFDDLFPLGLNVGDLNFATAQEITDFLPNGGTQLEEQATALALNIAFGDAGHLHGTISSVVVRSRDPALHGKTATEIFAIAEDVLINDPTPTNREYSKLISVIDKLNNEKFGCDKIPPPPPPLCPRDLGLTAELQNGDVALDWNDVLGASGYKVYRSVDGGALTELDTTTQSEFVDTSPPAGADLVYAVSVLFGRFETRLCDRVAIETPPKVDCPRDLGLTATPNDDESISLDWDDVPGADAYRVYRAESGGTLVPIATVTESEFLDTETEAQVTYVYAVSLIVGQDETEFCDRVEVTAIPYFGAIGLALGALGSAGAVALLRRRKA